MKKNLPTRVADVDVDVPSDEDITPDQGDDSDIADMRVPRPSHGPISPADLDPVSSRLRSRARLAKISHSAVTTAEVD